MRRSRALRRSDRSTELGTFRIVYRFAFPGMRTSLHLDAGTPRPACPGGRGSGGFHPAPRQRGNARLSSKAHERLRLVVALQPTEREQDGGERLA
jgi:hypothetical protein